MLGCASIQKLAVPCYIPPASIEYADTNATSFLPWTTYWDAERINYKLDYIYLYNRTTADLKYNFLKKQTVLHMKVAENLQQTLFSPEGPLGLLLPTIFGTGIGALLIKRPGDTSKKQPTK